MRTLKSLLLVAVFGAAAVGYSAGTAAAPIAGWVETFAVAGSGQAQAGGTIHLDFGVQNFSASTQSIIFAGLIRFSDGSRLIVQPRENQSLLPGEGVIRFGTFVLPSSAPLGQAKFAVGAYVRGPAGTLQGPRIVYDVDVFDVVP